MPSGSWSKRITFYDGAGNVASVSELHTAGNVQVLTYPRYTHTACTGALTTSRTVGHTYNRGFLVGVPGYATWIAYHPNQTVSQVVHANGVQWNQAMDPNQIARPASISTALAIPNWSSGTYTYDGAGNLTKTGKLGYLLRHRDQLREPPNMVE